MAQAPLKGHRTFHRHTTLFFDCAVQCGKHGTRYINHTGPLKLMAAVQPFISGAISKTVNIPHNATVDDIKTLYVEAWQRGVKCLAVYRDGSKGSQPLSTRSQQEAQSETDEAITADSSAERPIRKRLSDTRPSLTHKFSVGGHEGYITVGFYEDGSPGEVFLRMSKEGTVVSRTDGLYRGPHLYCVTVRCTLRGRS